MENHTIPQLNALILSLEEELSHLEEPMSSLTIALEKILVCQKSLEDFGSDHTEIMAPLTSLVYSKGTLVNPNFVLVDIGTGYHILKTIPQASDYYSRKASFVENQISLLHSEINAKKKYLSNVYSHLDRKLNCIKTEKN
ncbi:prefoldin alpha subunit [Babesia microti strain RI]|uniref:Prefoldin alpha subunit n=1 Tax=Babesia microti (strain RI) TaxID=1133968 RepID=A0A0K3ASU0_BABMR|nr:prefoldin alpha subunit [Babesia microti strain RI]CTQ40616.1 prefoldin alpha subunit [Babesia microti strain RI]|eukprot:XP_012648627.1 prefoldin alpha subunit [Babesia microti strain RI]